MTQLAQHATRPEPVLDPRPGRREVFEALRREATAAGTWEPDGRAGERDLRKLPYEIVEGPQTETFRPQTAAGTGCIVGLAALLRAVDEDGLQRRVVEACRRPACQRGGDPLLVRYIDDGRNGNPRAGHHWLPLSGRVLHDDIHRL